VLDGVDDTVPFIAHMIGVDAYAMDEPGWRRVQAKLKELVPHLRFVSSDDTALAQGLASGELVADTPVDDLARLLRVTFLSSPPITQDSGSFAEIEQLFAALGRTIAAAWGGTRARGQRSKAG